jgi:hypothetical protein
MSLLLCYAAAQNPAVIQIQERNVLRQHTHLFAAQVHSWLVPRLHSFNREVSTSTIRCSHRVPGINAQEHTCLFDQFQRRHPKLSRTAIEVHGTWTQSGSVKLSSTAATDTGGSCSG